MAAVCGLSTAASLCGAATLDLRITDARTGQPLPARVRVRDVSGTDHVPASSVVVKVGPKDRWFVCDGAARLELAAGTIDLRVEHGIEYTPRKIAVSISDSAPTSQEIRLRRWINMRERGYACGENHLHVSAAELGPQLAAEGLDFGTSLQWWNGPKFEVPPGEGFVRVLEFAGRQVPTSIHDFEIEHEWGAAYAVGVPAPVKDKPEGRRPNLPMVRAAHEAGALIAYQAGYSREVLLDALLGYVDVVNVISNNFLRHRFQPRTRYSNPLGVEGLPVYPETAEDMMRMSTDWYYRLLNCGLPLAAGAESATGAKPTPVGTNRVYVRAGPEPTLPQFLAAWRAGRNFVTCGPMLFLRVNGREPGDPIALDAAGGELSIEAEALADQPLTGLDIVVNGEAIPDKPRIEGRSARLSVRIPVREGCWIAARCTERDELLTDAELAGYDQGSSARPSRLRFAHTSPVYVTVGGKGARVQRCVDEAARVLDAFETFALRGVAAQYHDELKSAIRTARDRLLHP